jgi:quercetin dioxygenase-like cupin family protein
VILKASSRETAGAIGLFEAVSQPGFGPPRHIHDTADEWFYIVEGQMQFLVGDRTFECGRGGLVFIPRGTVHAPKVLSELPARVLCGFVPGGNELAFEEFSRLGPEAMANGAVIEEIAKRYASRFVGPPL